MVNHLLLISVIFTLCCNYAYSQTCSEAEKVNLPSLVLPSDNNLDTQSILDSEIRLPRTGSLRPGPVIPSTTTYGVHTPGGSIPRINVPTDGGAPGTVIPGVTQPNVTQPEDTFPQILPHGTTIPSPFEGGELPY